MVKDYVWSVLDSVRKGEPYSPAEKEADFATVLNILERARARVASVETSAARGRWDQVCEGCFAIWDKYPTSLYTSLALTARSVVYRLGAVVNEITPSLLAEAGTDPVRRDAILTVLRESADAAMSEWPIMMDSHLAEGIAGGRLFPSITFTMRLRFLVEDESARPLLADRLRDPEFLGLFGTFREHALTTLAEMEATVSSFRSYLWPSRDA